MKKRINISIEYALYVNLKESGTIKNLSAFVEKCISNHLLKYDKNKKRINFEDLPKEEQKRIKELEEIANTKWTD